MREKFEAMEKAKMDGDNIKMMVSNPDLKKKITTNITEPNGAVYWYIRFNTPLDPESVTKHSMNVTQTDGYIINTIITYDFSRNLIVLNPCDLYRQNEYYLLNISTKVRSDKGKPLPKPVHIMFKLKGDEISDFRVIKNTAGIPKPRKKPESVRRAEIKELMEAREYDEQAPASPVNMHKTVGQPVLPYGPVMLRVQLAVLGIIWLGFSLFFNDFYITLIGLSLVMLGFVHILFQLARRRTRSAINYTRGVMRFNKGRYGDAQRLFDRSLSQDPHNDFAKYAAAKVKLYR
ncbi:MAG: hypothetical protein LBE55_03185 [Clostridiales bacterium]|jgi:hypothetical protein|nr:hypothetical protein [Clostridiales bacterium]